ncbi:MAG: helix-turn-helix domain-containing protein, partial [bacterium]
MDQIFEKNLITTKDAGDRSGYSSDYLARLARSGKIDGKRIGHSWFIDKDSLTNFLVKQGDRKIDYARELARARETEYHAHHSLKHNVTKTLSKQITIPYAGLAEKIIHSQALAFSVALVVITTGAFMARAAVLPRIVDRVTAIASETSSGFKETFGNIPSNIASKINSVSENLSTYPERMIARDNRASEKIAPTLLAQLDFSSLRMKISDNHNFSSRIVIISEEAPKRITHTITRENFESFVVDSYVFLTSPSRIVKTSSDAYVEIGSSAYSTIVSAFTAYRSLIEQSGIKSLALASSARDSFVTAPSVSLKVISQMNLAFGNLIIEGTHLAIRTDVAAVYGLSEAVPAGGRAVLAFIIGTGNALASATTRVPSLASALFIHTTEAPALLAPALAQTIFDAEYAGAVRFVAATGGISDRYLAFTKSTGRIAYEGVAFLEEVRPPQIPGRSDFQKIPIAIENAYLGALGKSALALESLARLPNVTGALAAIAPAFSASEQIALTTYTTLNGLFEIATHTLASLIGPPPTIVVPSPITGRSNSRVVVATTTPRITNYQSQTTNSYPSYTTVVQGVSEEFVNQSLSSLRSNVLATVSGMIQPVSRQAATNVTTIQQVNMIQDLSNLIVRNGDFRGGSMTNGVSVSAASGTFTNLSASGALSSDTSASAPYFVATSTTATSTFAGPLAIGTTTPFGNGILTIGTSTPLLHIDSNTGNIGINTLASAYRLDINGTLRAVGDSYFN